MTEQWRDKLPAHYRDTVATPVEFEYQSDAPSQSQKIWGFDPTGTRCFYQHEFTVSEDRFDVDEFPIRVDVFWECVTAWRLPDGLWLKSRKWTDRLEHCPRRYSTDPLEVVGENQLQR